jgi:hypothetical protein
MIDRRSYLGPIACPAASECVALDAIGNEITFDPASPGTPALVKIDGPKCGGLPSVSPRMSCVLMSIACPSTTQCTAGNQGGQVLTFNPLAPRRHTTATIDNSHSIRGIACVSTTQCTTVDGGQQACTRSNCTVGNQTGRVVTFNPLQPTARRARRAT